MTLRLIMAARKSRSGNTDENERYKRQESRAAEQAQRDGHVFIETVRDTASSQSLPWERKNLKAWMTDPRKLAAWDGLYVPETDRLARMDDKGFHDIEHWLYENDKVLLTAEGVQFPPRDDADRYQWLGLKRRARTYWEDVRDKHRDARKLVQANGAATGRPPFGYRVTGAKYGKRFEPDPATGPLALEVLTRLARSETATAVGEWLGVQLTVVPFAPVRVRAQRVIKMARNDAYLGERDGHCFEMLAPNMAELLATARASLDGRTFDHGGNRVTHAYSSRVYCECGATCTHHQSTRKGKPVGQAKYRCSRGRRGIAGEAKCSYPPYLYEESNAAVEAAVGALTDPDGIMVTTGGDTQKQARLDALAKEIERAIKVRDYSRARELQEAYEQAEATASDPVDTRLVLTGKTIGQRFLDSDMDARRSMLTSGQFRVYLTPAGAEVVYEDGEVPESWAAMN